MGGRVDDFYHHVGDCMHFYVHADTFFHLHIQNEDEFEPTIVADVVNSDD